MSSRGFFDYKQDFIRYVMDGLIDYIHGHEVDDDDSDFRYGYYDDMDYVREHMHTKPNRYGYSEETIKIMEETVTKLAEAYCAVDNIDRLLEGGIREEDLAKEIAEDYQKYLLRKKL